MSIKCVLTTAALAGALSASAAQAQEAQRFTVESLYTDCMAQGSYSICDSYIAAVADAMDANRLLVSTLPADTPIAVKRDLAAATICPDTATYEAFVQAFKNWAQQNPKYWGEPALLGVASALAATWSCPAPQ